MSCNWIMNELSGKTFGLRPLWQTASKIFDVGCSENLWDQYQQPWLSTKMVNSTEMHGDCTLKNTLGLPAWISNYL